MRFLNQKTKLLTSLMQAELFFPFHHYLYNLQNKESLPYDIRIRKASFFHFGMIWKTIILKKIVLLGTNGDR